ncbi:MAG: cell division FtsA domain-containing protein [Paenisporosarcina sp.]
MAEKLFALDIGTRSVVGIILEETNDSFHVADLVIEEHKERAMLDGQIHNVVSVAEAIRQVKESLEMTHGPLRKVSVAAAGRALKTEQALVEMDVVNRPLFSEEDISRLELAAVQQAQQQLLSSDMENKNSHYYCVGYSVLYYRLDGEEIGSLVDQQGTTASVEVIATFLPRVVVESLLSALKRADLEMEGLTLEPIAAINVLIPPSMRRLNVALVDIGAGTSDIAITDKGTVVAYGMVPTAGDEITEAMSDHFLLDFPLAEEAKRMVNDSYEIRIQDILGFDQYFPKAEVIDALKPAVINLAHSIAQEILRLNNQQPPKAVMLVGGGSLTPEITKHLANELGLPENRVAIRGIDAIQSLTKADHVSSSPELVTPIGIAIAARKTPIHYMSVQVNEKIVRLFELKEMTVGDALLAANIRARSLYGKPGLALAVKVNGIDIMIPGEHGHPASLRVNNEPASTKSLIKNDDVIDLVEGRDGEHAKVTVHDLIDAAAIKTVTIDGTMYIVEPHILVNEKRCTLDTQLKERDVLSFQTIDTAEAILNATGQTHIFQSIKPYFVSIDDKSIFFPEFSSQLLLNGTPIKLQYAINDGDTLTVRKSLPSTVQNIADQLNTKLKDTLTVTFQGKQVSLEKSCVTVSVNGKQVDTDYIIQAGSKVSFQTIDSAPWIFQDVFRFSNWKLPEKMTGQFSILRNGQSAGFDEPIFGGDQLEIRFEYVT